MSNHDRYDMDILKQLTRIANSLEKIEKVMGLRESRYSSVMSFDDSGLDDEYYYDGQMNEKYGIDNIHRRCYKINHGTSKGICDTCSSHDVCLMIKEKEDLSNKEDLCF